MESKGNANFRKITFLEFFKKKLLKGILKFSISLFFSASIIKKRLFLAVFMAFAFLLLASSVQR